MREAKEDVQDGGNDAKTEQDSELKHGTEDVISHVHLSGNPRLVSNPDFQNSKSESLDIQQPALD